MVILMQYQACQCIYLGFQQSAFMINTYHQMPATVLFSAYSISFTNVILSMLDLFYAADYSFLQRCVGKHNVWVKQPDYIWLSQG